MKMLTEDRVDTLWKGAVHDKFLAEMCERWLDTGGDTLASYDATILSHIKGSRIETNSLAIHYVACHRPEVPEAELTKILTLPSSDVEPTDGEVAGRWQACDGGAL